MARGWRLNWRHGRFREAPPLYLFSSDAVGFAWSVCDVALVVVLCCRDVLLSKALGDASRFG